MEINWGRNRQVKKPDQHNFSMLICDTDFLIKVTNSPLSEFHTFMLDSRLTLATVPAVVGELKGLSNNRHPLTSKRVRNALSMIDSKIKIIGDPDLKVGVEADNALIEFAKNHREIVLVSTLDARLLSRLERLRLSYLTLRRDKPFVRSFPRAIYLSPRKE